METKNTHDHGCQGPVVLWGCEDVLANSRAKERARNSILAPIQKALDYLRLDCCQVCVCLSRSKHICPGGPRRAE